MGESKFKCIFPKEIIFILVHKQPKNGDNDDTEYWGIFRWEGA